MIDPVSALALATGIWNGIKKAVEVGREVQDVYSQLSQWAGAVSDLHEFIAQSEKEAENPPLFKKLSFKSDTSAAFDTLIAKQKLKEMEEELRHEFLYGGLQHLGMDGLREFYQMRREIKEKRERMLYAQARRRKEFVDAVTSWALGLLVLFVGGVAIWFLISIIINRGL